MTKIIISNTLNMFDCTHFTRIYDDDDDNDKQQNNKSDLHVAHFVY